MLDSSLSRAARGVPHGLRCAPGGCCHPCGMGGRLGSPRPRSLVGLHPENCWPRHTPRIRSNTVRSCFATICNVTLRAVPNAMGNMVTGTYLPGYILQRVTTGSLERHQEWMMPM